MAAKGRRRSLADFIYDIQIDLVGHEKFDLSARPSLV
jgi:hypothetical protein